MSMVIVAAIEAMHRAKDLAFLTGRQLSILLESIGECFYMLDAEGRFTYVNAQMERHVGRPRRAMLGRLAWEIFPEVVGSELDRHLRVAMAEGRPVQFQVLSPVSRRWLEIRAYPSSEGLSVFYRDVTERQEAEEELRKAKDALAVLNQQLEEKVLERTAKLRESVADLEQFSYSISHDFRSPLRSMQAFSALLLEEYQEKLAPTAVNYLLRLDSSAKRMLKLLEAVLSYTGVARSEIDLTRVDLDQLIREILEQYPNLHPDSVDIEIVEPLLPVRGSVAQLTQCLSNVLGNAVKFVALGTRPSVRIWTEKRDGWVRVCVRDNGIGIDPRIMDRLWGMFERGVSRDEYEGTGIGLSVVKRAVERMGGTVGVESEFGKGSTFWFQLPAVAPE
jgi:PAS domain S-box-containing protein